MKYLIFLATSCMLLSAVSAQNNSALPVRVTSVEGITEYKLDNGLRVLLFPDPSKPTITVNITYLVGSRLEGYGETGMAHLLEHMLFKGSTKHTNVPQELTEHGSYPNGSTWFDRTNYFETFSATDENLNWALDLESDRMVNSFVAEKDLKSEFSVVRNEFESGENYPSSILMERVLSSAYLWHNYGKSTIGSKEDIEKVSIPSLQAFYKKYYQPDDAVLMITGKIDTTKTLQLVSKYFGAIPKPTRVLQPSYTVEPEQDGERSVTLRRVGDVQVTAAAYHIPSGTDPDFASVDVLNEILNNQPSGRLYKALIETQKASAEWGFPMALKDPGVIYFSADVLKEKSLKDAQETMLGVLDSLQLKPVTEEEVTRARNKLLKDFELFYRNSERIGLDMSEYMAEGDWRMAFIYRDNLKKVTPESVNNVIKNYFKSSNRTTGIFIPEKAPDRAEIPQPPNIDSLVMGYKGNAALADAEVFDASPENIDKRTETGSVPGGAKYAILRKTTRGSIVNMRLTLRVGTETSLQNKGEIGSLTASMMRRGTTSLTYQQLNDTLDKLQSRINVWGGAPNINFGIQTTKENLPAVLALVDDMLHHPAFPQKEFDVLKQEELSNVEQQKSDPQAIASNTSNRIMNPYPKGSINYTSTFDELTDEIKATTLDEVKDFYKNYYGSSNATVAVVGDCDSVNTQKAIISMLQNWSGKEAYKHVEDKYFDVAATDKIINTPDKKNAMYMVGMNLKMNDEDPDYASLVIGNFMLGGGFLNSKLATRIRQKEGVSYGVGSYLYANSLDKSGMFGAYAIYNPDNLKRLDSAFKDEMNVTLKNGFTADELKAAKAGYLQNNEVDRSEDGYLTYMINNNLFLNRNMGWQGKQDKQISALTAEQVNTAMRKYVKPEKFVYVKAGDFEKKAPENKVPNQ